MWDTGVEERPRHQNSFFRSSLVMVDDTGAPAAYGGLPHEIAERRAGDDFVDFIP